MVAPVSVGVNTLAPEDRAGGGPGLSPHTVAVAAVLVSKKLFGWKA